MKILQNKFWGISFVVTLLAGVTAFGATGGENPPRKPRRQAQLQIKAAPWGPTQMDVEAAKQRVLQSADVQNSLRGAKYRLVAFEYVENANAKTKTSLPPTRYRVIFYDYTNDRTFVAESDFAAREPVTFRQEIFEPNVGSAELDEASKIVKADPEFAALDRQNRLEIYDPMPPISTLNGERLINIGIRNSVTGENQIVGVSFKNEKLVRYENNAPPTVKVSPDACGVTGQGGSTGQGVAGQLQLTVTLPDQSPLWEMLVIRPSSSTGGEGSGIEIRDVKYKGKSVLKRGHAPVLNVKYLPDGNCNQFRDWQYAEGFFNAPAAGASDPAPGFRVLAAGQVATTVVESRVDQGTFQGVAIYTQDVGYGPEVVMVSEMNAGWYRYIMEWRFAPDGTIRPRYGFGSITNSCTCSPRNHHVYWRFDFDIVQPNNKIFQIERGRKFQKPITTEAALFRSYQTNRSFLIQNSNGNEAYQLTPNITDEEAYFTNPVGTTPAVETFGAGDIWLLRFQGTAGAPGELNDPNTSSAINLAPWVNNESLENQDVVVWYGAHQYRIDDASRAPGSANVLNGFHVVGPDLRPVRW